MSQEVFIQRTSGQFQNRLLTQYSLDRTLDVFDTIYTVGSGVETVIKSIYVCNRSTTGTLRLCHDEGGTSYDSSNALYYDHTITAGNTLVIDTPIYMTEADSLGASSDAANIFTISIYGEEIQTRAR